MRFSKFHLISANLCYGPTKESVERPRTPLDWARHISIRACGGKSEQLWTYSLQCGATVLKLLKWESFGTVAWPAGSTLHCAFLLQRHPDLHTLSVLSADGKPPDLHSHNSKNRFTGCLTTRFLWPCMDPAGLPHYVRYILGKTLRRRPTPAMNTRKPALPSA